MLTAENLLAGLQQFQPAPLREIVIHPARMAAFDRLILAPARRRESYAAGRRLARHIHALRSK